MFPESLLKNEAEFFRIAAHFSTSITVETGLAPVTLRFPCIYVWPDGCSARTTCSVSIWADRVEGEMTIKWNSVPIVLAVLVWLGLAGSASAGVNTWTTTGPAGGRVQSLAVDPVTTTIIYAGTDGGGIFRSTNGGASWTAINAGLSNSSVSALAVSFASPTTLYAGTDGGGVFKSTTSGTSWSATTGLGNPVVNALAIHPGSASILYAGTAGGVFTSTNGGASWTAASTGLTDLVVKALAIDPATPTTLYAGTAA